MSDRTLVLLKPDAVERKLVGEVVSRFEAKNLDIVAMELRTLDADTLARHYEEHVGKGFYADLVEFMGRGPVVAMVVEGPGGHVGGRPRDDGRDQPAHRGARHDPRRPRHPVHREPRARQRFARLGASARSAFSSRICNIPGIRFLAPLT